YRSVSFGACGLLSPRQNGASSIKPGGSCVNSTAARSVVSGARLEPSPFEPSPFEPSPFEPAAEPVRAIRWMPGFGGSSRALVPCPLSDGAIEASCEAASSLDEEGVDGCGAVDGADATDT